MEAEPRNPPGAALAKLKTQESEHPEARIDTGRDSEGRGGEQREKIRSRSRSYSPGRRQRSRSYERRYRPRYIHNNAFELYSYICLLGQVLIVTTTLRNRTCSRGPGDIPESPLVAPGPTGLPRRDVITRDTQAHTNRQNTTKQLLRAYRDSFENTQRDPILPRDK